MIDKFKYTYLIFIVLCHASDIQNIYHLNSYEPSPIVFHLEPNSRTGYLINQINTNISNDLDVIGFKINGSFKYPIFNIIPQKIHISLNDTISSSQISFYQDHDKYFYDTNIAMNSYLGNNVNLLTLIESKSVNKNNYSQKFLFSYFKEVNASNIEFGYMYHYESIPTFLSESQYNRTAELFNGKFIYKYFGNTIKLINNLNLETSNTNRYNSEQIEFQSQTQWNDLYLDYIINSNFSFSFNSNYKSIFLKNSYIYFNKLLIKLNYSNKRHQMSFGNILLENKNSLYFDYLFNHKNFAIFLKIDKEIFLNINNDSIDIITINNKEKKVGIIYNNDFLNTKLTIGENFSFLLKDKYRFFLIEGGIKYKWFGLNLNYTSNNSTEMFINNSTSLSASFSPLFDNKKYRLYVKTKISRFGINSRFVFNQNALGLIENSGYQNNSLSNISIIDGEFGILFKYFKISIIKENMFNDYYQYSSYKLLPNSSNYLVNITWLFKD